MRSRVEALIIGGGATGTGIARDLAMRGTEVMLVEAGDFAAGATGANHGMLHSGARYAVTDPVSARECAEEGAVLKRIARFCIEDTGGLFVSASRDDAEYVDRFLPACGRAGIRAEEIDTREAREIEPCLDAGIKAAVKVPDASIDPFFLALGNVSSARRHGATVLNHSPVRRIRRIDGGFEAVIGRGGRERRVAADVVINAAGAWAGEVAAMLGVSIPLCIDKGTLVVFNGRLVNRLVNRLRPPSDGDILVPHRTATILGTTSSAGAAGDWATSAEVERLIAEAEAVLPGIKEARAVRAYAGARPLLGGGSAGRGASRTFQVIDHACDGVDGLISVAGGKLTTFRLMAERTSDAVMEKLGRAARCRTADEEIEPFDDAPSSDFDLEAMRYRHGTSAAALSPFSTVPGCGCEAVTRGEMEHYASSPDVSDIGDLMRRTRAGMGYCQAGLCAVNMASAMDQGARELQRYYGERWRGVEPVLFGEQLRQEMFKAHLLKAYGIDHTEEGR